MTRPPTLAGRLVRLCLAVTSAGRRPGVAEEAARAFDDAYRRARRRGRGPALAYLARTLWDVGVRGALRGMGRRPRRRTGTSPGVTHRPGPGGSGPRREGTVTTTELVREIRHGLRRLGRAPGFTLAAVVTLALGIGANAVVFGAIRAVILAPPPFERPETVVFPKIAERRSAEADTSYTVWSWAKFERLARGTGDVFAALGGYGSRTATLTDPGTAARIAVEVVQPGYFEVLGVEAVQGRLFGEDEGDVTAPRRLVLLSHGLWTERFGRDPQAVGSSLTLQGERLRILGVLPPGFRGLTGDARAWVSVGDSRALFNRFMIDGTQAHWMHAVARLAPGVAFDDARTRVRRVGRAIEAEMPMAHDGDHWVGADLLSAERVHRNPAARTSVAILAGAALLVLLVAVANLAGLQVARTASRRRERAVHRALGAGRLRLAGSVLVETLLLALAGAAVGLGLAHLGMDALAGAWPETFVGSPGRELQVVEVGSLAVDGVVVLFALVTALVCGILFGVVPALAGVSGDLTAELREGGGATRRRGGLPASRSFLVGAQTALALVLLVGASLLLSSLIRLQAVERGYDLDEALVFRYDGPERGGDASAGAFHARVLERLRALPGVRAATLGSVSPLGGHASITLVGEAEGRPPFRDGEGPPIGVHEVDARWFETLGIELLSGRTFGPGDLPFPPSVVVLSRTAAREIFGDEEPLGRRFRMGYSYGEDHGGWYRVVGVADDVLYEPPEEGVMAEAYLPLIASGSGRATAVVATEGDPFDRLPVIREAVTSLDPDVPLAGVTRLSDLEARATGDTRVLLTLVAAFAGVALLLVAVGLYGIVAFTVADRRRELGLRMALGAPASRVVSGVLHQGVATALVGLGVGLVGAWLATRLLTGVLYEVGRHDPASFLLGALALLAVSVLASWLPARRITALDPADTLKAE